MEWATLSSKHINCNLYFSIIVSKYHITIISTFLTEGRNKTVDTIRYVYVVSNSIFKAMYDSLVEKGANGGLAGSDIRLIVYSGDRTIRR